jgi:hypothetical protein
MGKKLLIAVFAALSVGTVLAEPESADANVNVTWEDPKGYTDVKPANQTRKRFMEQTFNRLDDYFVELAEDLPEGYKLDITVTNLDLAGQVWPQSFVSRGSAGGEVRLVKDIDIPRMAFSYELTNNGQVVKSAEVNLKDMAFMQRISRVNDSDSLRYEKRMLKDWFNKEFAELTASK